MTRVEAWKSRSLRSSLGNIRARIPLHIDYESFTLYESSVINPYSLYSEYE